MNIEYPSGLVISSIALVLNLLNSCMTPGKSAIALRIREGMMAPMRLMKLSSAEVTFFSAMNDFRYGSKSIVR